MKIRRDIYLVRGVIGGKGRIATETLETPATSEDFTG